MKNADLPAMPTHEIISACSPDGNSGPYDYTVVNPGLTKREMFAMAAMQGLLHNHHGMAGFTCADISEGAVAYADALLAELERTK